MGNLGRRVGKLERRHQPEKPKPDPEKIMRDALLQRLTDEELDWLEEGYAQTDAEQQRRWSSLLENAAEILAREPQAPPFRRPRGGSSVMTQ